MDERTCDPDMSFTLVYYLSAYPHSIMAPSVQGERRCVAQLFSSCLPTTTRRLCDGRTYGYERLKCGHGAPRFHVKGEIGFPVAQRLFLLAICDDDRIH